MRHDLGFLALIAVGLALVYGVLQGIKDEALKTPGPSKASKVLCYVQTVQPQTLVCNNEQAYMKIGARTAVPPVPR